RQSGFADALEDAEREIPAGGLAGDDDARRVEAELEQRAIAALAVVERGGKLRAGREPVVDDEGDGVEIAADARNHADVRLRHRRHDERTAVDVEDRALVRVGGLAE